MLPKTLHPIVSAAARGTLPDWAVAGPARREHMRRVAGLLDAWGDALGLGDEERARWRAAAYLHDALRDADPEALREQVAPSLRGFDGSLLHGPAAAARLEAAGVDDTELRAAVAFHTTGDPDLGRLGRALYAADFLEPGRTFLEEWRAGLRARMAHDSHAVLLEIVRARIEHRLDVGGTVLPATVAFWNTLVAEGS